MSPDTAPLKRTIEATVGAPSRADATQDQVVGEAPYAGVVSGVKIVPEAAVRADATNFRTFRLVNKGQAGAGTTVAATFATDTPTTDDLAAFDEKVIPLSTRASDLVVAAGDVLVADETFAAGGVAHSGYRIIVEITRS